MTTLVISDTGEKIVLSTENNVTTVIVYSDTVTASGSEDAVSTAIQTTDTTIVMGTASVTEPNATVTEVTVETAQIEVPLIEDPEESARELAASLGLTDTTKYNIEIDTTTDTVTWWWSQQTHQKRMLQLRLKNRMEIVQSVYHLLMCRMIRVTVSRR